MELIVTGTEASTLGNSVTVTDIAWKGLRCTIAVEGEFSRLDFDIRTQPGNPNTSVTVSTKTLKNNGTASVVVENEDLEGSDAAIVLLDETGGVVAQVATVIGGDEK